ncbi:FAD-binding protein [Amycolatopsis magusensis]|uniref:3-oxo-5alpha-steroid 4-dehydrogenase n=1 Tax=Amycolatopsis magusensis TaxID=882444 RepID=A0ABS4Q2M9_9PSEU|nr:FAD-binding protein [Amycolatopsis magusensis]MBP2185935.1 3-oxo-5alpha-steroid 4-dehydrogenase [Amycolatopsis magusensis]
MSGTVQTGVLVVGFGAAGACAALEAAEAGADVLVLDRFEGGGATTLSGGIVYAGGGTAQQRDAGVTDSVDAMHAYLRLEVGDVVSERALRSFCEGSVEMIRWLERHGVPFEGSLCPEKTSYPGNRHYLYYSGSESSGGFRDAAEPAPRGHRAKGRGTSGKALFTPLAAQVRRRATVLPQTRVRRLIQSVDGTVTGVIATTLRDAPAWARALHRRLGQWSAKPGIYVPALRKKLHRRVVALEERFAREIEISAHSVILTAGGFIANREWIREHAPAYRRGLQLGTVGDDGSGIELGRSAGGATAGMGRVSAWRFLTPPSAFLGGLLVNERGQRVIDESRYGAAVGEELIERHGGKGWLLLDEELVRRARAQGDVQWFQRLQTLYLLKRGRVLGGTIAEVARRAGVDPDGLAETVVAADAVPDPMGKPAAFVHRFGSPPYSLVDVSIRPSLAFPCPMLTLGGLVVDEGSGRVLDGDGRPIPGLYAAGRTAVGICSRSYVSGLSLADCVFSGRRAGNHSGRTLRELDKNENVF